MTGKHLTAGLDAAAPAARLLTGEATGTDENGEYMTTLPPLTHPGWTRPLGRWPGNHLGDVGMEIEQLCRVTVPDVIEGGSTTDLRLHADVLERIAVLVDEARRQMGEVGR